MSTERLDKMTPHLRRASELLSDGEWHDREEIMREMGKVIPPGIAIRFQEQVRAGRRTQRLKNNLPVVSESPERIVPRENNTLITMGRRGLALKALHAARRVETKRLENGKAVVRLRPALPYIRRTKGGGPESRTP